MPLTLTRRFQRSCSDLDFSGLCKKETKTSRKMTPSVIVTRLSALVLIRSVQQDMAKVVVWYSKSHMPMANHSP